MKKLFLILVILGIILSLSSCEESKMARYGLDEEFKAENLEQWDNIQPFLLNLKPLIEGFHGELIGDGGNISANGSFTGYEILDWFGQMVYCNDDGAIIWIDKSGIIFRLDPRGQKEKICPHEECRINLDSPCGHLPVYRLVYSNGFLYFALGGQGTVGVDAMGFGGEYETRQREVSGGVFIYRYDIDKHEFEKIMGLQGVTLCELTLNGRYLYAQTYNFAPHISDVRSPENSHKVDFTVTRMDLETETAVVVYSDLIKHANFDKISEPQDFKFTENKIIFPVNFKDEVWDKELEKFKTLRTGVAINTSTIDMRNFNTLIEIENEMIWLGGKSRLYDGEIYFATGESGLNRVSTKTGEREILNRDIMEFCIDGDFLYYMARSENGQKLYRVLLDYTREINFNTAVQIYAAEEGYNLNSWSVHKDYLYAEFPNAGHYRIKLNSQEEPYLFYNHE